MDKIITLNLLNDFLTNLKDKFVDKTDANRKILINVGAMDSRNCYFNAYDVEGGMYIDASVSYTAFGYWR